MPVRSKRPNCLPPRHEDMCSTSVQRKWPTGLHYRHSRSTLSNSTNYEHFPQLHSSSNSFTMTFE